MAVPGQSPAPALVHVHPAIDDGMDILPLLIAAVDHMDAEVHLGETCTAQDVPSLEVALAHPCAEEVQIDWDLVGDLLVISVEVMDECGLRGQGATRFVLVVHEQGQSVVRARVQCRILRIRSTAEAEVDRDRSVGEGGAIVGTILETVDRGHRKTRMHSQPLFLDTNRALFYSETFCYPR